MSFHFIRSIRVAAAIAAVCAVTACKGSGGPAPAQAAGPPPMGVATTVLATKPIQQTSEFIATVRSLRSSTVQPEVEGVVTRIFVKSGDHVRAGAPLVQIKPDKQQATV